MTAAPLPLQAISQTSQIRVTAAEITRNFGMWQDRATLTPVIVTHHGRARCVLLSAGRYEQLASGGLDAPARQDNLLMQVLAERIDLAFVVIDTHFCICEANTAAAILLGNQREVLIGRTLPEVWLDIRDSIAEAQIKRSMLTGEATQARLRLPGKAAIINAFPWPDGLGLLIRVINGGEDMERSIAEAGAIQRLVTLDRSLSTAKLSMRGTLTEPDPAFCAMTKISPERLSGARLLDLIPRDHRPAASALIEKVLTERQEGNCDSAFITNDGQEVRVHLAIAVINEETGMSGAMVMVRDHRNC